jgi:hypothetical protein
MPRSVRARSTQVRRPWFFRSLAGPLAITTRLVGVDFSHAFQQVVRVGLFDFRFFRSVASSTRRRRQDWTRLLNLIRHDFILGSF